MKKILALFLLISVAVFLYLNTFSEFRQESFCLTLFPSVKNSLKEFSAENSIVKKKEECSSYIRIVKGRFFSNPEDVASVIPDKRNIKEGIENNFDVIIPSDEYPSIDDNMLASLKYLYSKNPVLTIKGRFLFEASVFFPLKKDLFTSEDIDSYMERQSNSANIQNDFSMISISGNNSLMFKDAILNSIYAPDILIVEDAKNSYEIKNDKTVVINYNDLSSDAVFIKFDLVIKNKTEITVLKKNVEIIPLNTNSY